MTKSMIRDNGPCFLFLPVKMMKETKGHAAVGECMPINKCKLVHKASDDAVAGGRAVTVLTYLHGLKECQSVLPEIQAQDWLDTHLLSQPAPSRLGPAVGRGARHRPDRAALAQAARHGDDPRLARAHAQGGCPSHAPAHSRSPPLGAFSDPSRRLPSSTSPPTRAASARPSPRSSTSSASTCSTRPSSGCVWTTRLCRMLRRWRSPSSSAARTWSRPSSTLCSRRSEAGRERGGGEEGTPSPSLRRPSIRCAPSAERATRLLLHRTASRRGGGRLWTFARLERALRCARADRARCGWVGGGGRCGCKSNGRVVSDVFGGGLRAVVRRHVFVAYCGEGDARVSRCGNLHWGT